MTALAISMAGSTGPSRLQPGQSRDQRGREYEEDYCYERSRSRPYRLQKAPLHRVMRPLDTTPKRVPPPQAA